MKIFLLLCLLVAIASAKPGGSTRSDNTLSSRKCGWFPWEGCWVECASDKISDDEQKVARELAVPKGPELGDINLNDCSDWDRFKCSLFVGAPLAACVAASLATGPGAPAAALACVLGIIGGGTQPNCMGCVCWFLRSQDYSLLPLPIDNPVDNLIEDVVCSVARNIGCL